MRSNANNPYVGLRPFEVDESILFFGRNDQTLELMQRLHDHHFVAVVGSSGSGKSSLLRAGLIPSLKAGYLVDDSDHWLISIMKPGQSPLYNLAGSILRQVDPAADAAAVNRFVQKIKEEGADALLNLIAPVRKEKNINFFLLVDQFEELFRFTMEHNDIAKKDEAIDFVNIMLELSQQKQLPFYVVITMRSDFIGDCARFYGLPEAMNESQYLVPRLNRVQMKTAIEGPAKLYGGKINPALTSRLLNELGRVKDELPLLQHALMRIWDHAMDAEKNGELDLSDYESIGGIENALSNHADEALAGMTETELALTKKIFQSLTAVDEYGHRIRRPVLLSGLKALTGAGKDELLGIINLFIKDKRSFLVISKTVDDDDKLIDISHESLIRQWKILSEWVDEEGESASNYLQLSESAGLYKQKKKDFLTGSELQIALEWYDRFEPVAAWANRYKGGFAESIDYLKASEKDWNARMEMEQAKKRKQRNLIYAVIALLSLLTIGAGITALKFRNLNRTAEANYLVSEAKSELDNDPTLALALVDQSLIKHFDSLAYKFRAKIYSEHSFYKLIATQEAGLIAVAYSPDEKTILTGSADSIARLLDAKGNTIREFKGHSGTINAVAFSPDGKIILTGSSDKTARLWDLEGNMLQEFKGHTNKINAVTFSPDGNTVLTGSTDNTARLWDLKGNTIQEFKGNSGIIFSVAFSPDGKMILTGALDKTARLWDLKANTLMIFKGHSSIIRSVTFSPGGDLLLTGSEDSTARLWDLKGNTLMEFKSQGEVNAVNFSPDGKTILTGTYDKKVRLWDLQGNKLQEFRGHAAAVSSVIFSKDGRTILTGSSDNTLRLWMLKGNTLREFMGHTDAVNAVVFSPDGKTVLTGSADSTARLWSLDGKLLQEFKGHTDAVYCVSFSPGGKTILTGSADSTARLWDRDGKMLQVFIGHSSSVMSVAFSPDEKTILTGSGDHSLRLWAPDGKLLREFKGHGSTITSVRFSPDGKTILSGSLDKTARLWNLKGDTLQVFKGHAARILSVAFSPDGKTILTGSGDHTARLWDMKGNMLQEFKGHSDALNSVGFSPDGNSIITGSGDQTARLWDMKGNMLQEFKGHSDAVNSVGFSPDGNMICTGSMEKTVRLWQVPLPLKDFLKSDKFEGLTSDQKKRYGIE